MKITKDNWVFLGMFAVVLAVFITLILKPQYKQLGRLQSQDRQIRDKLQSDEQQASYVPQMARQMRLLHGQVADFDRRLPPRTQLAPFLRAISRALVDQHLDNQVIEPGNPVKGPLYNQLPIIMKFEGSFAGLASFIQALEDMPRFNRIERISVQPAKDSDELHVEMQVNIYFTRA